MGSRQFEAPKEEDTAQNGARPEFLVPWRLVMVIFGTLCAVAGAAHLAAGPAYVPGAVSGLILGVFGTFFGSRAKTIAALICVAAGAAVSHATPFWVSIFLLAPLCAGLVSLELSRFGTRVGVLAIMSWITLNGAVSVPTEQPYLLLVFAVAVVIGLILATALGLEGRVPHVVVEQRYAIGHGSALALGLVLAQVIATLFDNPQSHWIALLFTVRALDPPGSHVAQAVSRGVAMVAGAGVAGAAVLIPASPVWFVVLGVIALLAGLRYLPSGRALASALMSAGIVLASAPTVETAMFRAEAAILASMLVLVVFYVVSTVLDALQSRPAT